MSLTVQSPGCVVGAHFLARPLFGTLLWSLSFLAAIYQSRGCYVKGEGVELEEELENQF